MTGVDLSVNVNAWRYLKLGQLTRRRDGKGHIITHALGSLDDV